MRLRRDAHGNIWIPKENPALEAELDKLYVRVPGTLRWLSKKPTLVEKTKEFVKTVTSGYVDDATYQTRLASCMGCPALVKNKKGSFCGGCSCGTWQLARLDGSTLPKLKWKRLRCPLGRPGFFGSRDT